MLEMFLALAQTCSWHTEGVLRVPFCFGFIDFTSLIGSFLHFLEKQGIISAEALMQLIDLSIYRKLTGNSSFIRSSLLIAILSKNGINKKICFQHLKCEYL